MDGRTQVQAKTTQAKETEMTTTIAARKAESMSPFSLDVPQAELDDLRSRIDASRLPDPIGSDDWSTGVPLADLREGLDYWSQHFDWRALEQRVNQVPQFLTEIDGQRFHLLHARSSQADATPIVLLHGWPGSFLEFLDLIPLLTEPAANGAPDAPAFHVVVPSLPGFGWSTPLADAHWSKNRVARGIAEIMARLGYERYVVQGGDFGAALAPEVARVDPEHCVGVHVNGSVGAPYGAPGEEELAASTDLEKDRFRRVGEFMQKEFGYISIQSTRPQLIGAAMSDSPVGQLAWMLDKFRNWTFPFDAAPADGLGWDRILGHVSLYWLTRSAGSAAYTVYAADANAWGEQPTRPAAPVAAIMFAHDIGIRRYAEQQFDIVRWTDVDDRGGHFAAMEEPELLVGDIREFVAGI
jgi:epoxide hydrolase